MDKKITTINDMVIFLTKVADKIGGDKKITLVMDDGETNGLSFNDKFAILLITDKGLVIDATDWSSNTISTARDNLVFID